MSRLGAAGGGNDAGSRPRATRRISNWLKQHPELTPVDTVVSQSSDQEFHCLTVTLSLAGEKVAAERAPITTPKRVVPRPIR